IKTRPEKLEKEPIRPENARLIKSDNHVQNWIDCIRSRARPIADVAIGASSITVCHLGNIAYWTGRTIRWDPEKLQIIGDEAAARLLDRPKRAPYTLRA
ncbi:MAG: gfo/Idh/MocA family oxidoreductase, partial [Phycisphaerae bacterium]